LKAANIGTPTTIRSNTKKPISKGLLISLMVPAVPLKRLKTACLSCIGYAFTRVEVKKRFTSRGHKRRYAKLCPLRRNKHDGLL
jgi:broad specificity polyphosphatase/5'/3'-nucleotidase SurE